MSGLRTPLGRARGLGSAKDGVHHWWMQRLTAVALALLTPWFLWLVLTLPATNLASVHSVLRLPHNALFLLAFVIALFWHARLGLQVVIEDYVHQRSLEMILQVLVTLSCAFGALAAVIAIGRIVFAA
jgi:succinate dehydrogenase / fumarate reductase membrane anchor subunit